MSSSGLTSATIAPSVHTTIMATLNADDRRYFFRLHDWAPNNNRCLTCGSSALDVYAHRVTRCHMRIRDVALCAAGLAYVVFIFLLMQVPSL